MKNIASKALILFFSTLFVANMSANAKNAPRQNDSASFISISGKILDSESKKPVMYTNAFINGTSIGTVANGSGEFLLKIPKSKADALIGFSHLGYKTKSFTVSALKPNENVILMEAEMVALQEIIVRVEDPTNLLKGCATKYW